MSGRPQRSPYNVVTRRWTIRCGDDASGRASVGTEGEGSAVNRPIATVIGLTVASLLFGACGTANDSHGEVFVSAAASLADAFSGLESAFEKSHPDTDVVLNLGGSSVLREQILAGAPADVFASADPSNMEQVVVEDGTAGLVEVFARNQLEIAVPTGNPGGVTGLDDFARGDLLIGLCAVGVPCGDYGRQALGKAGVVPAVDTEESNVRALLTKIEAGELDAGIVYATDVMSSDGDVEGIGIPASDNVSADYPIARLAEAPNPDGAQAFIEFVLSDEGGSILAEYGFVVP